MRTMLWQCGVALAIANALVAAAVARAEDSLPSWKEGAAKQAVVAIVEKVTGAGSPKFVPRAERIAVFDNDGTHRANHVGNEFGFAQRGDG